MAIGMDEAGVWVSGKVYDVVLDLRVVGLESPVVLPPTETIARGRVSLRHHSSGKVDAYASLKVVGDRFEVTGTGEGPDPWTAMAGALAKIAGTLR